MGFEHETMAFGIDERLAFPTLDFLAGIIPAADHFFRIRPV